MSQEKPVFPAETDRGTVLQPDQVAIVCDEHSGYKFLIPDRDDNAEIPDKAAAIIAAAMRLDDDEDFCKEMLKWFEERHGK